EYHLLRGDAQLLRGYHHEAGDRARARIFRPGDENHPSVFIELDVGSARVYPNRRGQAARNPHPSRVPVFPPPSAPSRLELPPALSFNVWYVVRADELEGSYVRVNRRLRTIRARIDYGPPPPSGHPPVLQATLNPEAHRGSRRPADKLLFARQNHLDWPPGLP